MSHFFGTLKGQAGEAMRRGSKSSGLVVNAASWQGAVHIELYVNSDGIDYARVCLVPWHGQGNNVALFDGPVSGKHAVGFACRQADPASREYWERQHNGV
jgi:hypothetical protein